MKKYTEYIVEQVQKLLAIDSPTGYTQNVSSYLMDTYRELGYDPVLTVKGGVLVKIADGTVSGANTAENSCNPAGCGPILLMAHVDTLGAMVRQITPNGRLKLTPLGGMNPNNSETENCRIYTRDG